MKIKLELFVLAVFLAACASNDAHFDASGTFEAVEVIVSSEASGTIEQLDVEEGETAHEGQLLGWIDSTQLYLKKKQLLAQINAILSQRPHIATQLASYEVQLKAAAWEQQRILSLFKAEAATQKQVDDANAQVAVIRRQMDAHRSSLDISAQGLVSQTLPISAQVEQLDDQLKKSRIVNPLSGTILTRYAEAHEIATPGKPLYKIANLTYLELRAYITGDQLPLLKLGQKVKVLIDSGQSQYRNYDGTVSWISSKAEFTPKTIQTKEERSDLVYALKVRVKNDGYLKIGMYGEVQF
jgi:HlyD family secretion protein